MHATDTTGMVYNINFFFFYSTCMSCPLDTAGENSHVCALTLGQ